MIDDDYDYSGMVSLEDSGVETATQKKAMTRCKWCTIILSVLLLIILIILLIYFIFIKKTTKSILDNNWDDSYKQANEFISKLNLKEKINLLYGTENMKIETSLIKNISETAFLCKGQIDSFKNDKIDFKGMCLSDGVSGIRFTQGTSIPYQAPINTAATFNKNLIYKIGESIGQESKMRGINTLLSPCVNMIRSPQGGRIWETFGEDPYLSGIVAENLVKGIQNQGVIATLKNFVLNEQETYRKASSSNIDLQALMDIYVEPFYRAIKNAKCGAVMASYNAVNNTYVYENKFLLTNILRNILGFRGFVMSDWWAINSDNTESINSGLDMNMPGGKYKSDDYIGRNNSFWNSFEEYVLEGNITEQRIAEAATRIIAAMYQMEQMEDFPKVNLWQESKTNERISIQREAATESQILLKNSGILPLKNVTQIAVIGNDAFGRDCNNEDNDFQCKNSTNEVMNGHMALGCGSGSTSFGYMVTPLEGITNYCNKIGINVISSGRLFYINQERNNTKVHVQGVEDIEGAMNAAQKAQVAIVFVGANSGEEYVINENTIGDRPDLDLWHSADELIESVLSVNKNTIVVINAPGVVNMPWKDKVKAIIFSGFPGAESGNAIADILFGEENPSGHLPFVWGDVNDYPMKIEKLENLTIVDGKNKTWKDVNRYDGINSFGLKDENNDKEQYNYNEGLYVGQRWFNKNNKTPIFYFGHGLSYSKFEYENLVLSIDKNGLKASFSVTNASNRNGKVVPMMFITFPDYIGDYPSHILKGFEKVSINAKRKKSVTITADDHALSYFNVEENKYVRVNQGKIKVCIAENADPTKCKLNKEIDA